MDGAIQPRAEDQPRLATTQPQAAQATAWQRDIWVRAFVLGEQHWATLPEQQRDLVAAVYMAPTAEITSAQAADVVMAWAETMANREML